MSAIDAGSRAVAATRAPCPSAASAISRPRPLEQPVTNQTAPGTEDVDNMEILSPATRIDSNYSGT
jgi:hypothetical protein